MESNLYGVNTVYNAFYRVNSVNVVVAVGKDKIFSCI